MLLSYGLMCLNIDYFHMGFIHLLSSVGEMIRVHKNYNYVFDDYLYLTSLSIPSMMIFNWGLLRHSKMSFLMKKKVLALSSE